jgi:hypothetical protein
MANIPEDKYKIYSSWLDNPELIEKLSKKLTIIDENIQKGFDKYYLGKFDKTMEVIKYLECPCGNKDKCPECFACISNITKYKPYGHFETCKIFVSQGGKII